MAHVRVRTVAIVPARAGSKGIPGKNRRRVAGRSLVEIAVDAAVQSRRCATVVVTTDDPISARQARSRGAIVLQRPRRLAGPKATTPEVIEHALHQLRRGGQDFDRLVVLQPTSPLRTASDVRNALRIHDQQDGRNVISVVALKGAQWSMRLRRDGRLVPLDPRSLRRRRQDLQPLYVPNGALYVIGTDRIGRGWFADAVGYVMPRERSIDIDDHFDLRVARALAPKK
jgi:CMP-N-acetylneuraminic acid synthetase